MSRCERIYLVGFMCSGKSAVGETLARKLNRPWRDLDRDIERRTGVSVTDLFDTMGEDGFRDEESECLIEASGAGASVISTGGGIVLREANVEVMRRTGIVLHLEVRPADVLARLGGDNSRPLLRGPDVEERIRTMMDRRAPLYDAAAHCSVQSWGRPVQEVCEAALEVLAGAGMEWR